VEGGPDGVPARLFGIVARNGDILNLKLSRDAVFLEMKNIILKK